MLSEISQTEKDIYKIPHDHTYSGILNTERETKSWTHRYGGKIAGCQRWGFGGSEMGESSQTEQTSSYKINKSWGCNVQHGDYS